MCNSQSQKATTEANFTSQIFGRSALTTITWFAKVVQIKHKCFTAWDYSNSHPDYRYPMYKSRHKIENLIMEQDHLYARAGEWEYERPIFDTDHDNAVTPNSPEIAVQSDSSATKRVTLKEPHETVPQKSSRQQTVSATERIRILLWSLMRRRIRKNLTLLQWPFTRGNTKNSLNHNPRANCNNDYRY